MGHGFCQWSWGMCMVFAACLVFCLGPGVQAIKCKRCRAKNDRICNLRENICEDLRDGAVCMVRRKYRDDRLTETFMKCSLNKLTCGAEVVIPEEGFRQQTDCCLDEDFCSNYI